MAKSSVRGIWAKHTVSSMKSCHFCRTPDAKSHTEHDARIETRVVANDPEAMFLQGHGYLYGTNGLPLDHQKGFGLILKSAELGSSRAHNSIAESYFKGTGVEGDAKKAKHHYEMAIIGGNVIAM